MNIWKYVSTKYCEKPKVEVGDILRDTYTDKGDEIIMSIINEYSFITDKESYKICQSSDHTH